MINQIETKSQVPSKVDVVFVTQGHPWSKNLAIYGFPLEIEASTGITFQIPN
jgi:hypothetical protein